MSDLDHSETIVEAAVFLEGSAGIDVDKEYEKMVEQASLEECAVQLPKGYLSASQISQYMKCPRQFYWRTVKGIIKPPSVAMAEGKAIHRGLEVGHREAVKSGSASLDIMLDAHADAWKNLRSDIDWNAENEDDTNENHVLNRDRALLSIYQRDHLPVLKTVVDSIGPFIERRFWVTIGEMHVPMLGYIDLLAEDRTPKSTLVGPVIVDHKVVSRAKSADDAQNDLQLTIYSLVTKVAQVAFNCLTKTKSPAVKMISAPRGAHDWRWAQFVIQQVAESISKGSFPPGSPGWWCSKKWCGWFELCHSEQKP